MGVGAGKELWSLLVKKIYNLHLFHLGFSEKVGISNMRGSPHLSASQPEPPVEAAHLILLHVITLYIFTLYIVTCCYFVYCIFFHCILYIVTFYIVTLFFVTLYIVTMYIVTLYIVNLYIVTSFYLYIDIWGNTWLGTTMDWTLTIIASTPATLFLIHSTLVYIANQAMPA